jgi:hypothetical protein
MKWILIVAATALSLSGCDYYARDRPNPYLDGEYSYSAGNTTAAAETVKCRDKDDCAEKWSKAQVWLATHSKWKIQTASDSVIQTFGPGSSSDAAFTIARIIRADGSGEIDIRAMCGNLFGCIPTTKELEAHFRNYLNK